MFNNIYRNKKVLVTGHTGFKGSWLITWLKYLGADIAGYSNGIPTSPSHFEELKIENSIRHFVGDIRSYESLYQVCKEFEPEFIFHLAAQPLVRESYYNPRETFEVNMTGTLNVLEVIRNMSTIVKVGVIITSDKCYDNVEWIYGYRENDRLGGEDPYSGSKGAAELIAKSYIHSFFREGFPNIVTTRAGNVIGGGDWAKDRIVPDIVRQWSDNKAVDIRSPNSTRPWQHVLEPLSGYLCLGAELYTADSEHRSQAYNFGPDAKINKTVGELIDELQKYWVSSPGWNNKQTDDQKRESVLLKLSCEKANIQLGWFPVLTFEETVQFTSSWYENFYSKTAATEQFTVKQIEAYCSKAQKLKIRWSL